MNPLRGPHALFPFGERGLELLELGRLARGEIVFLADVVLELNSIGSSVRVFTSLQSPTRAACWVPARQKSCSCGRPAALPVTNGTMKATISTTLRSHLPARAQPVVNGCITFGLRRHRRLVMDEPVCRTPPSPPNRPWAGTALTVSDRR